MQLHTCFQTPQKQRLCEQVEELVRSRTGGMIRDLRVEPFGEGVTITGRTATYYTKQLATHAALGVLEDVSLANEIEVY